MFPKANDLPGKILVYNFIFDTHAVTLELFYEKCWALKYQNCIVNVFNLINFI